MLERDDLDIESGFKQSLIVHGDGRVAELRSVGCDGEVVRFRLHVYIDRFVTVAEFHIGREVLRADVRVLDHDFHIGMDVDLCRLIGIPIRDDLDRIIALKISYRQFQVVVCDVGVRAFIIFIELIGELGLREDKIVARGKELRDRAYLFIDVICGVVVCHREGDDTIKGENTAIISHPVKQRFFVGKVLFGEHHKRRKEDVAVQNLGGIRFR